MNILHVVVRVWSNFRETTDSPGKRINIIKVKIHLAFLRSGKDVKDCVGGAAHCHIQCHGVVKGMLRGNAARQY